MYLVDKSKNDIIKLEERLFIDLKIKERQHLQEWIAKNPEIFGEELLIIQKEFDGFNDTNERLDLLALDKEGALVVIENKLDDTGRNVAWQALKYTSYCSTLSTSQIISIYQQYLDNTGATEVAKKNLLDFLDTTEDDLLLNDTDQRIIFVANHFRKEVTSTVLWLLKHLVQIQCFRATPYSRGEDIFLQVEQIIPLPETEEYMIDANEKEREEKGLSQAKAATRSFLIDFWTSFKAYLAKEEYDFLDGIKVRPRHDIGFRLATKPFSFCIGRETLRVELYFSQDGDKQKFDAMYRHKDRIEKAFGKPLVWERLEGKKASRIKSEFPWAEFPGYNGSFRDPVNWPPYFIWYAQEMDQFLKAVLPVWEEVKEM